MTKLLSPLNVNPLCDVVGKMAIIFLKQVVGVAVGHHADVCRSGG